MKNHTCRRGLSLLLAVCMALSMTNSFVYAQAGEEPANIVQQDTAEEADSSRDSSPSLDNTPVKIEEAKDQPAPNSSSGLPVDSEKAETPEPPAPPTCSCPAADSGEVAHSEDCPLYRKPDEPAQEKKCRALHRGRGGCGVPRLRRTLGELRLYGGAAGRKMHLHRALHRGRGG